MQKFERFFPQIAADALKEAAEKILVPIIVNEITSQDIIFTKRLLKSIKVKTGVYGSIPFITVGSHNVPYAGDREFGSRPHKPVRWKLLKWVRYRFQAHGQDAERITDAVMAKIEKYGTSAVPYLRPAWAAGKHLFFQEYVKILNSKIPPLFI
jgi:hypothetical protein